MIINVGSKNNVKIDAVKETIKDYNMCSEAKVISISSPSEISDQPKTIEETLRGAKNRAKSAFKNCNYSFGIESGLMKIPYTKTGYMEVTVCIIYDGKDYHIGLSSSFECPPKITELMLKDGLNLTQACNKIGISDNPELGSSDGIIGLLTKGRVTRKDYTKQAIRMALIHLENKELFQ